MCAFHFQRSAVPNPPFSSRRLNENGLGTGHREKASQNWTQRHAPGIKIEGQAKELFRIPHKLTMVHRSRSCHYLMRCINAAAGLIILGELLKKPS